MLSPFRVFLGEVLRLEFFGHILLNGKFNYLVRKEFIKDKAEYIVFILVGFNLRPHFVGRSPYFGCELLFVHDQFLLKVEIVGLNEKMGELFNMNQRLKSSGKR